MLGILAATVVGILLGVALSPPLWLSAAILCVAILPALLLRQRGVSEAYLLCGVVALAMICVVMRREPLPSGGNQIYEIVIEDIADNGRGRLSGEGRIVRLLAEERVQKLSLAVAIFADTSVVLTPDSRIVASCRVQPFSDDSDNGYVKRMLRRGFVGSVWLSEQSIVECDSTPTFISSLRRRALERLSRLHLSDDTEGVVAAISLGDRSHLSDSRREDFRRSGASHLLAVSGLHVGFVFLVVGFLLSGLLLLSNGQIIRSIAVVVIIWIYAAIVGFTPSVVRAATMFSLLQLAVMSSASARTLNTLCFAATAMLLWNPAIIYDVGFLLSCISVAAIVEWGVPAIAALRRLMWRNGSQHSSALYTLFRYGVDWLLSSVVVSVVASVATMPLVACIFGLTSLWGVIFSPVLVLLCAVMVALVIVWVIVPIGPLAGAVAWLVEGVAAAMNHITAWCSSHSALIFTEQISTTLCWAIYIAYILLTALWWYMSEKREG